MIDGNEEAGKEEAGKEEAGNEEAGRSWEKRGETKSKNSREQQGESWGHLLVSEHVVLPAKAAPAPSSAANAADRSIFEPILDLIW